MAPLELPIGAEAEFRVIRTVADSEILAAAATAIHRVGPVRLTLAHVAREAKLSPATLVQRFGEAQGAPQRLAPT